MFSLVGCCCMGHNCVADPCDCYSNEPVIGGGIIRFFSMPNSSSCCGAGNCGGMSCGSCGYGDVGMECGCGQCGCPKAAKRCVLGRIFGHGGHRNCYSQPCGSGCGCGETTYSGFPSGGCGAPSPVSPGCGCSQTQMPSPTTVPPVPAGSPDSGVVPAPVPPADGTTTRTSSGMQTQTVSYEEFQRLPGTIISGPGAAVNPAANNLVSSNAMAPRTLVSPSSYSARPANTLPQPSAAAAGQQAVWIPAKPN